MPTRKKTRLAELALRNNSFWLEPVEFSKGDQAKLASLGANQDFIASLTRIAERFRAAKRETKALTRVEVDDALKQLYRKCFELVELFDNMPPEMAVRLTEWRIKGHSFELLSEELQGLAVEAIKALREEPPDPAQSKIKLYQAADEHLAARDVCRLLKAYSFPVGYSEGYYARKLTAAQTCLDVVFRAGGKEMKPSGLAEYIEKFLKGAI